MSSDNKLAIITVAFTSLVSISTLYFNYLKDKEFQAMKQNHEREMKLLDARFKTIKEACTEQENLMEGLIDLQDKTRKNQNITNQDALTYYKSVRYLNKEDFETISQEGSRFKENLSIMLERISINVTTHPILK